MAAGLDCPSRRCHPGPEYVTRSCPGDTRGQLRKLYVEQAGHLCDKWHSKGLHRGHPIHQHDVWIWAWTQLENPCITNEGRLPDGWYNSANGHHINNKNNLIKGRVWGLANKACSNGTVRTELFVHTEETACNGQSCPTPGDDPYCWEGSSDYTFNGCVEVSHPSGVLTLHNWWHHSSVGGVHGVANTGIIWVGAVLPPT